MGRYTSLGACVAVLCGLLTTGVQARPAPSAGTASLSSLLPSDSEHVPGEVIVRYRHGTTSAMKAEARSEVATRVLDRLPVPNTELVKLERGVSVAEAVATYESDPAVAYAEPNFIYRAAALTPNDPRFADQWGLHNTGQVGGTGDADIDAPEAWDVTTGSKDVVIAVVDTGVAYNHPDLAPNIWTNPGEVGSGRETNGLDDDNNGFKDDWRGWDFFDTDAAPRDVSGHGTHVAGTIGAVGNDGYGMAGLNWRTSIMALRALGPDGEGTTQQVAQAFAYARDNGADIINASLGGPALSRTISEVITTSPKVLFVVAAGNEAANNDTTASYPCNLPSPNIVCVAATDSNDSLAGFSNYGAVNVDLGAPGSRIVSSMPSLVSVYRDGFEGTLAGWITGGTGTAWSRASDNFGGYAADSADSDYASNSNSWMQTASAVDLAGFESCQVSFLLRLATQKDVDGLYVEASSDQTTWTKLGGWSGSTGGAWLSLSDDLSAHDGGSVFFRFRFVSDGTVNQAGADIDDVAVRCLAPTYSGNEYAAMSGTSMATPHVAGAAALVLSAAPDLTVDGLKSALLAGTDTNPSLLGKTVSGGRLNIFGSLKLAAPGLIPASDASASPSPSGSQTSAPSPTPSAPTPSASPTVPPTPNPAATEPPADVDHVRMVSLTLNGHLRLGGTVTVVDTFPSCTTNVRVNVKRNGELLKRVTTDAAGVFSVRVRDRGGRYRVRAVGFDSEDGRCRTAVSEYRRHSH